MRRMTWCLLGVLAVLAAGCGSSERDRGKNSEMDRPRPAPTAH